MTVPSNEIEELEQRLQSAATENARLRGELAVARDRQNASAEIFRTIAASPSDARPVFAAIASSSKRLLDGFSATVLQFIGDELHLVAFTPTSPAADEGLKASFPRKIADFPTFALVRDGETIQFPDSEAADVPELNRRLARLRGFRSVLFMPLMNRGAPVGMISVTRAEPGAFAPDLVQLLQTFADQAVIAIENARLFNETREALERQTATADILKVMAASPSDVQPVFEAIAANANRLIGGFSTAVLRYIDGAAHLAAFTPTDPAGDRVLQNSFPVPFAQFPPYPLVANGAAAQLPDTELEPAARDIARARGYRSMLFTPLMSEGEAIGIIIATRRATGRFAEHHVRLLQTFADQAVIAIKNVSLFNATREALERQTATADILKVIAASPADVTPVFQAISDSAKALIGGHSSTVTRVVDGMLHLAAFTTDVEAGNADLLSSFPTPLSASGIHSRVARSGQYAFRSDMQSEPDLTEAMKELARTRGYRSILVVPMLRDGIAIGTIAVTRREPGHFPEKAINLLKTFADQAVIAVENTRLFNEVQDRTRELAKSLDDLRAAQDRLIQTEKLASLGQLTAGIAHEIKNPLNFVNNFASLSAELTDELNEVLAPVMLADDIRAEVDELTGLLKGNLQKVVQHGRRADSIVKNMLLHSREGGGDHGLSDINALVEESLNLAYHGARAEKPGFDVTLKRELDPAAGQAEVFPQEITRVLLNLISNGFHAVTKRKAEGAADYDPVVIAATRDRGDSIEIRIRDNGTGIADEVREKMFNPFFTTKPAGEGTGLGLSMSHDIVVKQHGGTIDVTTEPGAFTEFTILLPRKSSFPERSRA
ncbi:GAF domain-containing protein [Bradyrhizobium sp. 180]|uniref:GAF domain-containing sensor histidine kinase n=1 Tax=unclassified Bradyrhizobium TaxID=2631580 RepID=UPI001FF9F29D|nr:MULTISPECIES: GAF domain-containing protein [unclassified Bradyrhizobium]MCK1419436.1 GAF domain-containing protein [Bradyrhizobium sp. CW12]MCK1489655.1 GAF domain-containing protein [Bradyrhizobium sp. 180]MCK1530661.1 GAF domain-containing protein [Bradyrhizobium sp. 182]MCK1594765.1 GAF domain-containing protein [Bradyrhizobium sp. 164]MCK1646327.1 GAF domain-containing protein [Bradyrhizobium sp. 154]